MEEFQKQRKNLIESLVANGYIKTDEVRRAMMKVKRELFVMLEYKVAAYQDIPLPIPTNFESGTISQPAVHAMTLEGLKLKKGDKVFEIGCGSGILLAYVKEIVGKKGQVFGAEIEKKTCEFAKQNLKKAGYDKKIKVILSDGSIGLKEYAPFDKIIISAAVPSIPEPVRKQLKIRGIIVAVIGTSQYNQELLQFEKNDDETFSKKNLGGVVFVPLRGEYGMK